MLSKMFYSENPAYYEFSEHQLAKIDPTHYPGLFDDTIYESDEFRMYGFKIKRCPRNRSHDWTLCPFAHRGEKARRRDPRKYNYDATSCPDYRDGTCLRGDACPYAHGVFEFWLHPAKYRTRTCNAGTLCERKVCFFAHTPEELRDEVNVSWHHIKSNNIFDENRNEIHSPNKSIPTTTREASENLGWVENQDFLASLSGLTIKKKSERGTFGKFTSPDIDWIADLVE